MGLSILYREQSKEDDHLKQGTADYFKLELYLNQAVTGLTWHLLVNNSRTSRKSELPLFEQNTTRWSMADKVQPALSSTGLLTNAIHKGEFTNQAELAAADRTDLEKLGIPKGAAGLIIAAAAGKEPKLPNFEANFRQLLQGSRFNRPNEAIVDMIVRRLAARMIACSSVNQAADLYEDASLLPGASTVTHLMTQHDLRVNGPLYPRGEDGPSCLLTAMHASGRPCIVKLLDTRVSLDSSEQPGGAEAAAVRLVCDTAAVEEAVPVVKAEVITLHLSANHHSTGHGPGKYAAIVMPQYCGSVATQVQISEAAIEAGAQRMLRALEYVHSKGLVHMDVKGDNIFVDMAGDWWLGDLGSAVEVGAAVQSTTAWFSQKTLKGQPAKTEYDWYMLAVALTAEEVQKKSLRDLLQTILLRAQAIAGVLSIYHASSDDFKQVVEAMLEPISKVCLEKLSQTRCASKINRDDLRDVRKAFRTILQIQGGGFDVTAHYSQDLPEGEYAIKQPTACGPVAATVRRQRDNAKLIAGVHRD
ncbi:hypothetical protein WJX82_008246 [Trebouxia sp. C0006]